MSPRRRTDKLGPALDVELLLADLLARAEQGNLPLASDDEARAWESAWCRSNPGRGGADFEDMPLGIARRFAIPYVELILPLIPAAKRWRAEHLAAQAWAREHPRPPVTHRGPSAEQLAWEAQQRARWAGHREAFDLVEGQSRSKCAATRAYLIRHFTLADLVRPLPAARAPAVEPEPEEETP